MTKSKCGATSKKTVFTEKQKHITKQLHTIEAQQYQKTEPNNWLKLNPLQYCVKYG